MDIPKISIGCNGQMMPILGMGTASSPPVESETTKLVILEAMKLGYRHFDTASAYQTEQPLGDAITEAISLGLIQSRDNLFITSKLWLADAHGELVVPALQRSLQNLKLEYLDLYLIHRPASLKPGTLGLPKTGEDLYLMDFKSVWEAMENCQKLGLTKAIGVSNFTCKKLAYILSIAKIPPAINQVEVNPLWQQKKLREFCNVNRVIVTAYAPLGAKGTIWGNNRVLECEELKEIAKGKGKTLAQVCLRWVLEQGLVCLVKSFNKERMKENLGIFDWSLSDEEKQKISELPQKRACPAEYYILENGPIKSLEELWDGEI